MGLLYLLGLILIEACSGVDGAIAETAVPFSAAPTVLTIEQEKHFANTAGSELGNARVPAPSW
jgi:hypothetical protein